MGLNWEDITQEQTLIVDSGEGKGKIYVNNDPGKQPNTKVPFFCEAGNYHGDLIIKKALISPQALQGATIVVTPPKKKTKYPPGQAAVQGGKWLLSSYPSYLTINGVNGEGFVDQNPADSHGGSGPTPGGAGAPSGGTPFPSQGKAPAPQPLGEYRGAMAEAFTYYQVKVLDSAKTNVGEVSVSDPYVIAQLLEIAAKFAVSERIAQDHGKVERPESLPDVPF